MSQSNPFETLEQKLARTEWFLSAVTGLPITKRATYPADIDGREFLSTGEPDFVQLLIYYLALGEGEERYSLIFELFHEDSHYSGIWSRGINWSLNHGDSAVLSSEYRICGHGDIMLKDFSEPGRVKNARISDLLQIIGGVAVGEGKTQYMDYEANSLDSLTNGAKDGKGICFKSIYLAMMCHMKERGLQMPPIISKDAGLQKAMTSGETGEVDRILSIMVPSLRLQLEDRCYAHVLAEAEEIRACAERMKKQRSLNVPLTEKSLGASSVIKGESRFGRRYNILSVENDILSYGEFTKKVIRSLEEDGRYGRSNIWKECNLFSAMALCATGQIDMVLLDWRSPSYEELMSSHGCNTFSLDTSRPGMSFDETGKPIYILSDGSVNSEEDMRNKARGTEMRDAWMGMIRDKCAEKGVVAPPYFIVLYEGELNDISKIISQKLGNPLK